jgi:hypothetical protein
MKLDDHLDKAPEGSECDRCGEPDTEWDVYVCYDHEDDDEEYFMCSCCLDAPLHDWEDRMVRRAESGYADA